MKFNCGRPTFRPPGATAIQTYLQYSKWSAVLQVGLSRAENFLWLSQISRSKGHRRQHFIQQGSKCWPDCDVALDLVSYP